MWPEGCLFPSRTPYTKTEQDQSLLVWFKGQKLSALCLYTDNVLPGQANMMHIEGSAMVPLPLQATAGIWCSLAGKEPTIPLPSYHCVSTGALTEQQHSRPFPLALPARDTRCLETPPSHGHMHTSATWLPAPGPRPPTTWPSSWYLTVMEVTAQPVLAFLGSLLRLLDSMAFTRYGMYSFCCSGYVYILK